MSSDTTPRLKDGHMRVHTLDGASYVLPMAEYPSIRAAWEAGKAFWSGYGFFGNEMTIKLARVEGLSLLTATVLEAITADERADEADARRDAMLNGEG